MNIKDIQKFSLTLPSWIDSFCKGPQKTYPKPNDRMALAIELSRLNVELGTGGPFGAAVFDLNTKRLIAPGVNLVVSLNSSVFHAEIVAIIASQQLIRHYDLGGVSSANCEIVVSTEPCAMCMGAIIWSGIRSLICGARDEDARQIGFDEGPKVPAWVNTFNQRGINVKRDVMRTEAKSVLDHYANTGGIIYNARQGKNSPGTY